MMYVCKKEKIRMDRSARGVAAVIILSLLIFSGCGANENDATDMNMNDLETVVEREGLLSEETISENIILQDGYYGYLSNDGTKYSLGLNIEGFRDYYCLSVLPSGGGGIVIEGSLENNDDGGYRAKVNIDNEELLTGKYFEIRATENGAEVVSDDADFNGIVGVYPFVGDNWDDLEKLFSESVDYTEVAQEDEAGDIEGLEFVTDDELGGELVVSDNGNNYRFKLSLYRLTEIEGTAEENETNNELLDFTGIDASGNPIKGTIEQTEGGCVLTITDTTWTYLENGKKFNFRRKDAYLSDSYIYKDSDSSTMTDGDVELARSNLMDTLPDGKTIEQMIVNEIYARHGYRFKNSEIQAFFEEKSWYRGKTGDMDAVYAELNDFEKKNIEFLQK